eukprot:4179782-Amphidinium_carterae.1
MTTDNRTIKGWIVVGLNYNHWDLSAAFKRVFWRVRTDLSLCASLMGLGLPPPQPLPHATASAFCLCTFPSPRISKRARAASIAFEECGQQD